MFSDRVSAWFIYISWNTCSSPFSKYSSYVILVKYGSHLINLYTILVINVTAACVRGCTASVGLLVTGKEKKGGRVKEDNRQ